MTDPISTPATTPPATPSGDSWPSGWPRSRWRVPFPLVLLLALVAGIAGIWLGSKMAGSDSAQGAAGLPAGLGETLAQGGLPGAGSGGQAPPGGQVAPSGDATGGLTVGSVTSATDNQLTVQSFQGGDVTVTISETTTITDTQTGNSTTISEGDMVAVQGTPGAEGTVAATSIMVGLPSGLGGPPGGQAPAAQSGSSDAT